MEREKFHNFLDNFNIDLLEEYLILVEEINEKINILEMEIISLKEKINFLENMTVADIRKKYLSPLKLNFNQK